MAVAAVIKKKNRYRDFGTPLARTDDTLCHVISPRLKVRLGERAKPRAVQLSVLQTRPRVLRASHRRP